MLSSTALVAASRSVLPDLASWAARVILLLRAAARSRSSFVISSRFLFAGFRLCLGLLLGRLVTVGDFLCQPHLAQRRRAFSYRDVGRRDVGHRLGAFDLLSELPVQPDLLHLGGGFRFLVHSAPPALPSPPRPGPLF